VEEIGFEPITGNLLLKQIIMKHPDFESLPFAQFKQFHIDLNHYVKLSTSSIDYLYKSSDDTKEIQKTISNLVKNAGENWPNVTYTNPHEELQKVRSQLSKSSIMWVYSAFDVFLNHVNSFCSSLSDGQDTESVESTKESRRINNLYSKYNWDITSIKYLLIVYDLYAQIRHCVVHNMGKANKTLYIISKSTEFIDAISKWPTVKPGRKLSPPPVIKDHGLMQLNPHHAITYSDVCYRISKDINRHILDLAGENYYVKDILNEKVFKKEVLEKPECNDLYKYVTFQLKKVWGFETIEHKSLKQMIEDLGIRKKAAKRYNDLKIKADNK